MIDYSLLSPEEINEFIFLNFQIDSEVAEKYLKPRTISRWYSENLWIINKPEMDAQSQIDKAIFVSLLLVEPWARSQMKHILNISLDEKEIVKKLLPVHREVKESIEFVKNNALGCSLYIVQIILKEKETYQRLLEELTQIIRDHSPDADKLMSSQQIITNSPINIVVEKVQEEMIKNELRKDKETKVIIILPEYHKKILDAFLPYIGSEQVQALSDLFATGTSSQKIRFRGNGRQLGEFFQRLKKKETLVGAGFDTDLAEWLSQHFYFWHKDKKDYTPVEKNSILKVFREDHKPKNPIIF